MSSAAITTIVKMLESLPDDLQQQVADHICEYVADLEDEAQWESSFQVKNIVNLLTFFLTAVRLKPRENLFI
jgi:hypothetical protein